MLHPQQTQQILLTSEIVKGPSFTTRILWTIISSSVLTLFACIYSAIHPNIPSPKDSPNRILSRRLGMMIMALIAPELIVTWAMRQWFSARLITKRFKDSGYPNVCPKSESPKDDSVEAPATGNRFLHLLAVLVKGISSSLMFLWRCPGSLARSVKKSVKACFSEQSEGDPDLCCLYVSSRASLNLDYTWTQTHSFFVLMGGFMLYVDGEPYLTLRHDDILQLIREKCIDVPTLTAQQIHDKSKGNAISKGLIILQVAWFVMELITRAIYRLETTQLEVGTLAFAVLNFLTYAVWWDKPLNVQCPHPVYWKSTKSRPEDRPYLRSRNKDSTPRIIGIVLSAILDPIFELMGGGPTSLMLRVPTFNGSIELENSDRIVLQLAALGMATIFGGIHCMAWFFYLRHTSGTAPMAHMCTRYNLHTLACCF
ncbi:uncharacterized protein EDB93DRAFT_1294695 [Suillus bovinus]|uniref:uncharacterized protein n=1 Tax=Suillus bovinus TaxID=48563 RepID=UPI001B869360|nr:uncharacterized protein EDB93DRAFT_1294695 [Suillus bovinus]KAG2141422.1 hypothetical protein EDB93DRAFT_1294695 [Suillus bovinus]